MGTIDEYLTTLDPADAEVVGHAYDVAHRVVPEAEQGLGYGMPALTYKGKSLLSVMRTKQHFGIYPFTSSSNVWNPPARTPAALSADSASAAMCFVNHGRTTASMASRASNRPPSVDRSTSNSGPIISSFSLNPVALPRPRQCLFEITTTMT